VTGSATGDGAELDQPDPELTSEDFVLATQNDQTS
jgi:hypothetical protein